MVKGNKAHPFKGIDVELFVASVVRIWEEHTDGFFDILERDGKTTVFLRTREDDYVYDSVAEAVSDVLYTIGEWIKEG